MIWALILAAGESKRMGRPKMLLPFGGSTILETVIAAALRSSVDRTMVVVGAERERIGRVLENYPVEPVFNPDYGRGMLSSVQAGFEALPPEARAALVMLGDQPAVTESIIDTLIRAFTRTGSALVVPVFSGRRGHPLLIGARFREEVRGLPPAIGLRQLVRDHPEAVLEVPVQEDGILQDIDDPGDYRRALEEES
jgi:molybdenum cofactor cytidylyltransferase